MPGNPMSMMATCGAKASRHAKRLHRVLDRLDLVTFDPHQHGDRFRRIGVVVDDENALAALTRQPRRLDARSRHDLADARQPDVDLGPEPWSIAVTLTSP